MEQRTVEAMLLMRWKSASPKYRKAILIYMRKGAWSAMTTFTQHVVGNKEGNNFLRTIAEYNGTN